MPVEVVTPARMLPVGRRAALVEQPAPQGVGLSQKMGRAGALKILQQSQDAQGDALGVAGFGHAQERPEIDG